jgi:beta-glucosidase
MMHRKISIASVLAMVGAASVFAQTVPAPLSSVAHPDAWPKTTSKPALDRNIEHKINAMLAVMTIDDKVGQIIQADIAMVKPEDLKTYKLGSVLNGGNSAPDNDELAPAAEWLKLADAFYDASMQRSDGRPQIPVIWGTDAVHGNNNIVGATLFPHNIGLGAARDPALMKRSGASLRWKPPLLVSTGASRRRSRSYRTIAGAVPMKAIPRTRRSSPAMPARS